MQCSANVQMPLGCVDGGMGERVGERVAVAVDAKGRNLSLSLACPFKSLTNG